MRYGEGLKNSWDYFLRKWGGLKMIEWVCMGSKIAENQKQAFLGVL